MTCEEVRESLAEYLDELMPLERKLALENHLHDCIHCRQLIRETKTAVQWLQQAEQIRPPANLRSSVIRTLQQEKVRSTRLAPGLVQIFAAACVFVLLIAGNLLPLAGSGFQHTRGKTEDGVVNLDNFNREIYIGTAAENEPATETAEEPGESSGHGELAVAHEQKQSEDSMQKILTPRLMVNLGLSTLMIILLMLARKKRRELLP